MKFFIAAFMLMCIGASANAQFSASGLIPESLQENNSPLIVKSGDQVAYKVSMPPGLRMRNTGRTLTMIGGAMLIGGIVVYSNADTNYYNTYTTTNGTYTEGDPQAALGTLMIVGGVGMTVPGIIFWSKGSKKYKRHLEREAAFNYTGTAISFSYRF